MFDRDTFSEGKINFITQFVSEHHASFLAICSKNGTGGAHK